MAGAVVHTGRLDVDLHIGLRVDMQVRIGTDY